MLHVDTHGGIITDSGATILLGNEGSVLIMNDVTQDLHKQQWSPLSPSKVKSRRVTPDTSLRSAELD